MSSRSANVELRWAVRRDSPPFPGEYLVLNLDRRVKLFNLLNGAQLFIKNRLDPREDYTPVRVKVTIEEQLEEKSDA